MNNRIQELIQQSMPEIDWKARHGAELSSGERLEHMSDWFDKFAELVVRDCIIDFYRRYLDVSSNEDITVQVERYVKEHFGIDSSDNIRAGAEIHSDKGYSVGTQERYEEAKRLREGK
jgi:hypothetical protein